MDTSEHFRGKRITVMGLGLLGRGVGDVRYLAECGAELIVTDLKSREELVESVAQLGSFSNITFVLGEHRLEDFRNRDLILKAAGVPLDSPYIAEAKKNDIPVRMSADLFAEISGVPIIGVTGTRGKSTTASLIYELLRRRDSEIAPAGNVWLAGLPQKPMLEILDKIKPNDLVVLELSSWQLEILGEQRLSPHIALITNIYPDHLNRYKRMTDYVAAKKNIFTNQGQDDFAILNLDNEFTRKMGKTIASQQFWFSKKYFSKQNGSFLKGDHIYFRRNDKTGKLANRSLDSTRDRQVSQLKGEHNLENILAAATVAGILGIKPKAVERSLKNFKGLPGRIELIKEIKGIKYINDTTATTPDATIAALKSLKHKNTKTQKHKNIVLLAGGDTKNIPEAKYQELAQVIKSTCRVVILFSGRGSDQLLPKLKALKFAPLMFGINRMANAVSLASRFGQKGDIILLSPACASFNLFINEFDRGHQFNKIVKKL